MSPSSQGLCLKSPEYAYLGLPLTEGMVVNWV